MICSKCGEEKPQYRRGEIGVEMQEDNKARSEDTTPANPEEKTEPGPSKQQIGLTSHQRDCYERWKKQHGEDAPPPVTLVIGQGGQTHTVWMNRKARRKQERQQRLAAKHAPVKAPELTFPALGFEKPTIIEAVGAIKNTLDTKPDETDLDKPVSSTVPSTV